MDIEKLIEQLNDFNENHIAVLCGSGQCACGYLCNKDDCIVVRAATALSTLQAENEKLRGESVMHHNAADNYFAELTEYRQERNEALAELEQVKQERDVAVEYLRGQCRYCKRNLVCTSRKGPHSNCWEWRGIKED